MTRSVCALTLVILFASFARVSYAADDSHLRCLGSHEERVLGDALAYSPTVRQLAARVDRSDVIAFVKFSVLDSGFAATTRFMTAARGARYLLVTVDPRTSPLDLIARIGHELQHVVEIADAREVRDTTAMRALFQRIGWHSASPDNWETGEAVETGRQVAREAAERPTHVGDLARAR